MHLRITHTDTRDVPSCLSSSWIQSLTSTTGETNQRAVAIIFLPNRSPSLKVFAVSILPSNLSIHSSSHNVKNWGTVFLVNSAFSLRNSTNIEEQFTRLVDDLLGEVCGDRINNLGGDSRKKEVKQSQGAQWSLFHHPRVLEPQNRKCN